MTENNEQRAEFPAEKSGGTSRRTALKMGIATGVGIAAWSGPTITSLGGTPAYAAGCTFAVDRQISDDRNTDQSTECNPTNGGFGYHQLEVFTNMPAGFTMWPTASDPEGDTQPSGAGWNSQVCSTVLLPYELELQYPSTLNCSIQVEMYKSNGELIYIFSDIAEPPVDNMDGTSSIVWRLPHGDDINDAIADLANGPDEGDPDDDVTPPQGGGFFPSNTRYAIFLRCLSPGVPESCFDDPADHNF